MRVVNNRVGLGNAGQDRRRAKCLAAVVATVPLCALPAFGTAAAAESEVFDALKPGARVLTLSLLEGGNDDDLQGVVCQDGRTCVAVPYPYLFRSVGVEDLDAALHSDGSTGHQIVYGYSQGARVASDWLNEYGGTADAPTPDELSFVLIGNPGRKYGGGHVSWGQTTPATDYSVLDVSRQYDLATDVPDDPSNFLAMANALAGFSQVHTEYEDIDIYDPANYVWKEGNTTYVFVPADRLPILTLLYGLGLDGLADALDPLLRPLIEKGYDRSYLPDQPGLPPSEAESESEPEGLLVEPEQAVAAAVALPRSRNAVAQDQNDTANLLASSTDSRAEAESGSADVDVVDADVADATMADVDVDVDGTGQHGDLEGDVSEGNVPEGKVPEGNVPEENALEGNVPEGNVLPEEDVPEENRVEENAPDFAVDEEQGAAASQDSDSPQRSSSGAASSSSSDSSSDSDTSSGSQSPPDADGEPKLG
ncbi:MAG: PE-PPE domain-containing protein [Actinomycetia bacterium]|nr:PE-PPE domain-containing protein [Actinomycetes bacterium]